MKKLFIILLSLFLSLNLSAQFRSTSIYMDNATQVEQHTYISADEYLNSVSTNPTQSQYSKYPSMHKAPEKPNDPFPTPVDDRGFPTVIVIFALGFGVFKFVKYHNK